MTQITHEIVEALRLKAFETNAPSDRHAYYTTLSKAFQNGELVVRISSPGKDGGQEVEAVPDRGETCPHCKGEGCQPGDPEGAPLEACDYCNGSGKKISTQPASTALVEAARHLLEVGEFCRTDDTEKALRNLRIALHEDNRS